MAERAKRDPVLDEWRDNLAAQLRSILAIQRLNGSDLARAMGHSSIDTTKGYVLITPDEAAAPIEAISRLEGGYR